MKEGWETFSELCDRWKMNEYTVAKFVIDGELQSYTKDFMKIWIQDKGYLVDSPNDDVPEMSNERLTVAEVKELIFFSSDVEEFEKKKGITPHVSRTDVVDPTAAITPQDSTTNKEGTDKECTISEKDSEGFIRSLQVSLVSDTEIKIKVGDKRSKVFEQKELGFIKANSEIWKTFTEILKKRDHIYYVGKAHGANRTRKKSYSVSQKRLSGVSDKLLSFFNKTYQAQLPEKFKVHELIPDKKEAPGRYRFKFHIIDETEINKNEYENLPQETLLSDIETLSAEVKELSNRSGKDVEKKTEMLRDRLQAMIVFACEKEWLTQRRAFGYLSPKTKDAPLPNQGSKRKRHPALDEIFPEDEDSD
jgi:hypothetical protein